MRFVKAVLVVCAAVALAGCAATCSCVAPIVADLPSAAQAGGTLTLDLVGLYATCCDTGNWPFGSAESAALDTVTIQLTDNTGAVLDEEVVDVTDDATAVASLDVPSDASGAITVQIDGFDAGTVPVTG